MAFRGGGYGEATFENPYGSFRGGEPKIQAMGLGGEGPARAVSNGIRRPPLSPMGFRGLPPKLPGGRLGRPRLGGGGHPAFRLLMLLPHPRRCAAAVPRFVGAPFLFFSRVLGEILWRKFSHRAKNVSGRSGDRGFSGRGGGQPCGVGGQGPSFSIPRFGTCGCNLVAMCCHS